MSKKLVLVIIAPAALLAAGFQAARVATMPQEDPLIAGFRKVAVASVADAVDQVAGQRGFLSYRIRPLSPGQIVGPAVTALARPAPPEKATPALATQHAVSMIDNANPGEVGIIVMEGSTDVAAIGGLMGTAAKSRGMAGIIVDGGVRDVAELKALDFPVYATGTTPGTAVNRYATVAKNLPVKCCDVMIHPGDIIVAGEDGVVAVPKAKAAEVLKRAQEIDERESKMVPYIKQYKALAKVIQMFNRI